VPGTVYPDLQGGNLKQSGGGVMAYPVSMSPIPGRYKVIDPMAQITKEQVDNFATNRFPEPANWLLHQWEDRPNGLIHRSTALRKLPLSAPATQTGYIFDHQLLEGSSWGNQSMRAAYRKWLAQQGRQ
jgi:hypothetical protein